MLENMELSHILGLYYTVLELYNYSKLFHGLGQISTNESLIQYTWHIIQSVPLMLKVFE